MGKLLIFGALISDFDGTIFDTQKYHAMVESKILKDFGINVSPVDITRKYAGVSTRKMFQDFLGDTLKNGSLDELVRRKFDLLSEIVDSVDISEIEIPHALDTILSIYERGYKLAIATASNRVYVEKILSRSRISHCFKTKQGPVKILRPEIYDLVVTGEDVDRGKPAPDIFLRAAEILGVYPGSCAVVEDGIAGMQAGLSAGMYVFGLSGSDISQYDNDVRENSNILVRSWKTVDLFFKSGPHISSVSDIVKYERKSTR